MQTQIDIDPSEAIDRYADTSNTSCDWGMCADVATESACQYGEVRPYCAEHGAVNRECIAFASRRRVAS